MRTLHSPCLKNWCGNKHVVSFASISYIGKLMGEGVSGKGSLSLRGKPQEIQYLYGYCPAWDSRPEMTTATSILCWRWHWYVGKDWDKRTSENRAGNMGLNQSQSLPFCWVLTHEPTHFLIAKAAFEFLLLSPKHPISVSSGCHNKYCRLGSSNNRNWFFHSSGAWKI